MVDFSKAFAFKGRIGRAGYWRLTCLCMLAIAVAYFLMIFAIKFAGTGPSDMVAIVAVVLFFATCVAICGTGVRRLHDRGKSGFWIVPYYALPIILALLAMDPDGQRDALDLIALAIVIWAVVDLGVLASADPVMA